MRRLPVSTPFPYTTLFRSALTAGELRMLLGSAYTRFYVRPSFLTNYLRITAPALRRVVRSLDRRVERRHARRERALIARDRKSTRLNSSHRCISYAVFCLK